MRFVLKKLNHRTMNAKCVCESKNKHGELRDLKKEIRQKPCFHNLIFVFLFLLKNSSHSHSVSIFPLLELVLLGENSSHIRVQLRTIEPGCLCDAFCECPIPHAPFCACLILCATCCNSIGNDCAQPLCTALHMHDSLHTQWQNNVCS